MWRIVLAGVVVAGALAAPAGAAVEFPGQDLLLVSQNAAGTPANAPAGNAVISQDKRFARVVAFESAATNLVAGAGSGSNVYVVERAPGYGDDGSPWQFGQITLASTGIGGQPANGSSSGASLGGTSRVAPRCVAFVSAASNLVAGDTNGTPDAFVRDLRTGRTVRASVNSSARQSRGTVSEVAVNGLCTRVAFVSDGGDLALMSTRNRSWRSAVTQPSPAGRRQVYVRAIGGSKGIDRALRGLTFLASATAGRPADGESYDIAYAVNSRALTFASDAANLAAGDDNGATDIYQRVMLRSYGPRIHRRRAQRLVMTTQLISRTDAGSAGRGPSTNPATNVDGSVVAYTTTAPDLIGADPNGAPQVVRAAVSGGAIDRRLASRVDSGAPGAGVSGAPSVTAKGDWVFFHTAAADVAWDTARGADVNGVQDIAFWRVLDSVRLRLARTGATSAASNPATSAHGNYVVFERGGQVQLNYLGAK
jgi:Tol biopolymer transport system component